MKKLSWNDMYLLKYILYGTISAYDYSINSPWTLAWLLLATLVLAFWVEGNIKSLKD